MIPPSGVLVIVVLLVFIIFKNFDPIYICTIVNCLTATFVNIFRIRMKLLCYLFQQVMIFII